MVIKIFQAVLWALPAPTSYFPAIWVRGLNDINTQTFKMLDSAMIRLKRPYIISELIFRIYTRILKC